MARELSFAAEAEKDKTSGSPRWLVEIHATEKDGVTTNETWKYLSTTDYHGPAPEEGLFFFVQGHKLYRQDSDGTTLLGSVTGTAWDACAYKGKLYFSIHDGKWYTWDGTTLTQVSDSGGPTYFAIVYDDKIWTGNGVGKIMYSDDGGATWTQSTDLGGGSVPFDAAEYEAKLYVAQWWSNNAKVWVYDEDADTWSVSTALGSGKTYASTLQTYKGRLYLGEGRSTYEFDGTTWTLNTDHGSVTSENAYDRMAVYRDKLYRFRYAAGGSKVYCYDGNDWSLSCDFGIAHRGYRMAVWDDKLYVSTGTLTYRIYVYDGSSWAVNTDTASNCSALLGSQKYENVISDLGDVESSVTPGGGYGEISDFSFSVANGKVSGTEWSAMFDTYEMTNNEVSLYLTFANGAESREDKIPMFTGYIRDVEFGYETVDFRVIDGSKRKLKNLLREKLDFGMYPNAPLDRIGEPLPVVFGDFSDDPLRFTTDHLGYTKSLTPGMLLDFATGQYTASASPAIGGIHNITVYYDDVKQFGEALEWETLSRSQYVFAGSDDKVYVMDSAPDSAPAYSESTDISSYGTDIRTIVSYRGHVYAGGSCGTGGLVLEWDGSDWSVLDSALDETVDVLYEDRGRLWIGTNANIKYFDGTTITNDQAISDGVKSMARFRGKLFLGTAADGKVYERHVPEASGSEWVVNTDTAKTSINCLTSYQGNLYAGSSSGAVYRYDGDDWTLSTDFGGTTDVYDFRRFLLALYAAVDDKIYKFDDTTWTLATDMSSVACDVYSLGTRYTDSTGDYAFMLLAGTGPLGRTYRAANPSGTWSLVCDTAESDVKAFGQWELRPTYQIAGVPRRMAIWPIAPLASNDLEGMERYTLYDRKAYQFEAAAGGCDAQEWHYLFAGVGQPLGTITDMDFKLSVLPFVAATCLSTDFDIVLEKYKQGVSEWSTSVSRGGPTTLSNYRNLSVDIDHTVFDEAWDFENLTAKVTSQPTDAIYYGRHMYAEVVYRPSVSAQTANEQVMMSLEGYVDYAGNYRDGAVVDSARKVLTCPPSVLEAIARDARMLGLSQHDIHRDSFTDAATDLSSWEFAFVLTEDEEPEQFFSRFGESARSHIFWDGAGRLKWQTFLSTRTPIQTFGTWNIESDDIGGSSIHYEMTPMSELRNSNYILYKKSYDHGNYEAAYGITCSVVASGTNGSISDTVRLVDSSANFVLAGVMGGTYIPARVPPQQPIHTCVMVGYASSYGVYEVDDATTLSLQTGVTPNPPNGSAIEYYIGPSLSTNNIESYRKYGSEFPYELQTDLIRDVGTAGLLASHQATYFRDRHYVLDFRTRLGAVDLEVGDLVYVDHPLLPTGQGKTDTTANVDKTISLTETSWDVTDGTVFSTDSYYMVDREVVQVTAISGDTLTVSRAQCGTVAATHDNGQDTYLLAQKWEVIRLRTMPEENEIEVICREV